MPLFKCRCGTLTTYGLTCVSCSTLDLEDLMEAGVPQVDMTVEDLEDNAIAYSVDDAPDEEH